MPLYVTYWPFKRSHFFDSSSFGNWVSFVLFFFNVKTLPLKAQMADSNRDNPTGKHYTLSYMKAAFKPAQTATAA